uniref:Putative secreted protein n=1 Tax=Anopheles triannulatus TaxID=58253 RepID=A0A2M4B285_9DIPT
MGRLARSLVRWSFAFLGSYMWAMSLSSQQASVQGGVGLPSFNRNPPTPADRRYPAGMFQRQPGCQRGSPWLWCQASGASGRMATQRTALLLGRQGIA